MRLSLLLLLPSLCLLVACDRATEIDLSAAPADAIERGVELMPTHCLTCHGVGELEEDEMLAPPLRSVRARYLARYTEPGAFVDAMTNIVVDPQPEKSLMPEAVERYGLKAPVSLSKEKIRAVIWAIYAGEVERPAW